MKSVGDNTTDGWRWVWHFNKPGLGNVCIEKESYPEAIFLLISMNSTKSAQTHTKYQKNS